LLFQKHNGDRSPLAMRCLLVVVVVVAMAITALAAKTTAPSSAPTADYFSCARDADCTAVKLYIAGTHNCCWKGDYVAVAVRSKQAYLDAHHCAIGFCSSPVIPGVHQVPECVANKCQMVSCRVIAGGGLTRLGAGAGCVCRYRMREQDCRARLPAALDVQP